MYLNCFFFNDTATTEIYTLSLHDALPILTRIAARSLYSSPVIPSWQMLASAAAILKTAFSRCFGSPALATRTLDRKSTRLNSSHANISYAVFCLKKKNTIKCHHTHSS